MLYRCPQGRSSQPGASFECGLCAAKFWINQDGECVACPEFSVCAKEAGLLLPAPAKGYWVNTKTLPEAISNPDLFRCPRPTCRGSRPEVSSCWDPNSDGCDEDLTLCNEGSVGPLCGSCDTSFVFTPATGSCERCGAYPWAPILVCLGVGSLVAFVSWMVYSGRLSIPSWIQRSPIVGVLCHAGDGGALRVAWNTYQVSRTARHPCLYVKISYTSSFLVPFHQVIDGVRWNLDVAGVLPKSLIDLSSTLSIFSLDIVPFKCVWYVEVDFIEDALLRAAFPTLFCFVNLVIFIVRRLFALKALAPAERKSRAAAKSAMKPIKRQHWLVFLVITYLTIPPVTRVLFQSLDCISLSGNYFLRYDTLISCDSDSYMRSRALVLAVLLLYLSVPLAWVVILHRKRAHLQVIASEADVFVKRKANKSVNHLWFLFGDYRPALYFWESVEMLRRICFIGFLPLVSASSSRRAAFGVLLSICSAAGYREVAPFKSEPVNLLVRLSIVWNRVF